MEHEKGKVTIEILAERVTNWMETTTSYRKSLCEKIDLVNKKVDALTESMAKLPCESRKVVADTLRKDVDRGYQIGGWAFAITIASLFTIGAAWGALKNDVEVDKKKWEVLDVEHKQLMNDVYYLSKGIRVQKGEI